MRNFGKFGRNIISNASSTALVSVLQLGLLCLLFSTLDERSYAVFLTSGYLIGLLEIASDYGGRLWAAREFSVTDSPRSVLSRVVKSKVFYTLASAGALSLLPLNTLPWEGFLVSVLIAATQPGSDPFLWFLRGRERLEIEAGLVLVSRVAIVIGMTAAAWSGASLTILLLIWLAGNVTRMTVESRLSVIRPMLSERRPEESIQKTLKTISDVFPLGTALVLTCIFQRLSLYLLESFATVSEYNIYATAFKFVSTTGAVATAIVVSSFAQLTKAIAAEDRMRIRVVVRRQLLLVTAVFLPACGIGIVLMGPLSDLFASPTIASVAGVMVMLMPGLYLSCVNMGLRFTLNAYALNWQDVGAVVTGIAALWLATVFHGNLSWWTAGALGWFVGETTLLLSRMSLLWSYRKHRGVPVGVIFGAAVVLLFMVAVRQQAWRR